MISVREGCRLAALAVLISLGGGCNAILGVDNHSLKPGTGGTGGTGGAAGSSSTCSFDAAVPATDPDAGMVCGYIMPSPAYPASYPPSPMDNGVRDSVTGLIWEASVDPSKDSQSQAVNYCTLKGSGWRLPTRIELASLLDLTVVNPLPTSGPDASLPDPSLLHPMINAAFQNTPAERFWTSSHKKNSPLVDWYVGFDFGNSRQRDWTDTSRFRCVKGAPTRCFANRYEIRDADATVHDFTTGLTWQRHYSEQQMDWNTATTFCTNTYGGDWRLPSVTELMTIVDENQESPSIDKDVFPCMPTLDSIDYFWTLSQYAGDQGWAYFVTFIHGHEDIEPVTTPYFVRCVRWEGP